MVCETVDAGIVNSTRRLLSNSVGIWSNDVSSKSTVIICCVYAPCPEGTQDDWLVKKLMRNFESARDRFLRSFRPKFETRLQSEETPSYRNILHTFGLYEFRHYRRPLRRFAGVLYSFRGSPSLGKRDTRHTIAL